MATEVFLKTVADQEVLFNVKVIVPIKVTVDDGGPSLIPTRGEWFYSPPSFVGGNQLAGYLPAIP